MNTRMKFTSCELSCLCWLSFFSECTIIPRSLLAHCCLVDYSVFCSYIFDFFFWGAVLFISHYWISPCWISSYFPCFSKSFWILILTCRLLMTSLLALAEFISASQIRKETDNISELISVWNEKLEGMAQSKKNLLKLVGNKFFVGSCQIGVQHLYGVSPVVFCLEIFSIFLRKWYYKQRVINIFYFLNLMCVGWEPLSGFSVPLW